MHARNSHVIKYYCHCFVFVERYSIYHHRTQQVRLCDEYTSNNDDDDAKSHIKWIKMYPNPD